MSQSPSSAVSQLPAGMRSTRATRAMLALLRSQSEQRWTAAEVEAALARVGVAVNRVTVFRALDRLTQAGLLLRKVDDDRLTRYQWVKEGAAQPASRAAAAPHPDAPLRWRCTQCLASRAVEMDAPAQRAWRVLAGRLNAGDTLQAIELTGLCDMCSPAADATAG